jgi:hypothetical protein
MNTVIIIPPTATGRYCTLLMEFKGDSERISSLCHSIEADRIRDEFIEAGWAVVDLRSHLAKENP